MTIAITTPPIIPPITELDNPPDDDPLDPDSTIKIKTLYICNSDHSNIIPYHTILQHCIEVNMRKINISVIDPLFN